MDSATVGLVVAVLVAGALLLWAGVAHAALAVTCGLLFLVAFTAALMPDVRS